MKAYIVGDQQYEWVRTVMYWAGRVATCLEWPSQYRNDVPPGSLVFFVHWSSMVPDEFTSSRTCVNFHCTALPYGRGGHPIENLLIRGHKSTVMTAHLMDGRYDTGSILWQSAPIDISHGDRYDILERFVEPVTDFIVQMRADPDRFLQAAEPQDDSAAEEFYRMTDYELKQVWRMREEGKL